jgi:hypothetical protein
MESANYNSLFLMTGLKRHFWGTILALLLATAASASNWTAPATDLAKSISAVTGPGSVTIAVANSSSLAKSDVADIQRTIEAQLRTNGVRVGSPTTATSDVRVTLSENLQGYLWVAEIKQGNQTQVAMVSLPRTEAPALPQSGPSVTIRKTLLWSQPAQILDAYIDNNRLLVLDPQAVSLYPMQSGKWQLSNSLQIVHGHPFPRDLRGRLVPAPGHLIQAYLPGTVCDITTGSNETVNCHDGDDPWPLASGRSAFFNSGRNYFTGALVPASTRPMAPFYSLVALPRGAYSLLLSTGVDGRVHIDDGVNERTVGQTISGDWGSDIAAVTSKCGGGTQILVTSAVDDTVTDSLRAFEIPEHDPVQVSAAADFPGPITALWPHGDAATVVARNLRSGSYEAYNVSISCNQ